MQLKHAEVQSQCKEHKGRLQRLQNTYYLLKTACDKRMSDLHRIDRSLEESVNARSDTFALFALMLIVNSEKLGSSLTVTPTTFDLTHTPSNCACEPGYWMIHIWLPTQTVRHKHIQCSRYACSHGCLHLCYTNQTNQLT